MIVRKFCACGAKLERNVANDDAAYKVVMLFRLEHSGTGHGPISGHQYLKIVQRIIKRKEIKARRPKQSEKPLLRFTKAAGEAE